MTSKRKLANLSSIKLKNLILIYWPLYDVLLIANVFHLVQKPYMAKNGVVCKENVM